MLGILTSFKDSEIMAKIRSIVEISGTLSDITFVDSRAYGTHARAKRGTYTPITLAEGMQKSAKVQTHVNQLAKLIFDAVNAFVPGFKDGKFWSRLLAVFRHQQKTGRKYSYSDFDLIDIRLDYPTSKQGYFRLLSSQNNAVQLHYQLVKKTDYVIRLLRIASDATLLHPFPTEVSEVTIKHQFEMNVVSFVFTALPEDANVLFVLHCEQVVNGQPSGLLKAQSVKFFNND